MNRKSRMKSTLDSLFSSSKNQALKPAASPDPAPQAAEKEEEKPPIIKPTVPEAAKKPVEKKAPPARSKASPVLKNPAAAENPVEKKLPEVPIVVDEPKPPVAVEPVPRPAPTDGKETPQQTPIAAAPAPAVEPEKPAPAPATQTAAEAGRPENAGEETETDEEVHLVVFLLAGEAFGIDIQMVESIIKKQAITKVPHAEKFILGVTNLRGTVVPVVDLRQRFNMPIQEATKDTRIIVLNSEGGKNGIVVDEVMEVLRIPRSAIAPTPAITTTLSSSFIKGIARTADRLIILLEVNAVLSH